MNREFKVDRETLFFAFRYALGRMSYAPMTITDNIKANIKEISTGDLEAYIKEILEYKNYGMEMDKKHWLNFVEYLKEELRSRDLKST